MNAIDVRSLEIFKQNTYKYNRDLEAYVSSNAYLSVVMTNNCQRQCSYCINSNTDRLLNLPIEKALLQIKYLLKECPEVKEVILLGGEPTLHPELFEFVKRLRTETNLFIRLTSNGIKLKDPEFLFKLVDPEFGIQGLNVSFHNDGCKQFTYKDLADVYNRVKEYNPEIKIRMNSNIWKGNLDSVEELTHFILSMSSCCDEMRISNIIPKDSFSVNPTNEEFIGLSNDEYNELFTSLCEYYERQHISLFENNDTLGFVRYVLIPLRVPVIINWNIGSRVSDQTCEGSTNKINTFKCLVSGDISLSWNTNNIISPVLEGETIRIDGKLYKAIMEDINDDHGCDSCDLRNLKLGMYCYGTRIACIDGPEDKNLIFKEVTNE